MLCAFLGIAETIVAEVLCYDVGNGRGKGLHQVQFGDRMHLCLDTMNSLYY